MRTTDRGFTLLEVLVALLLFSLGLIGLAGLLTVSVKTNQSAYLRTQATFLAQAMADRMHANPLGLWGTNYNLNSISAPGSVSGVTAPTTCVSPSTCTPANLAARDLTMFQYQLNTYLPNALVGVVCAAPANTPSASQLLLLPPYSTTCEILIQWSQLPITGQNVASVQPEVFDWVFQP